MKDITSYNWPTPVRALLDKGVPLYEIGFKTVHESLFEIQGTDKDWAYVGKLSKQELFNAVRGRPGDTQDTRYGFTLRQLSTKPTEAETDAKYDDIKIEDIVAICTGPAPMQAFVMEFKNVTWARDSQRYRLRNHARYGNDPMQNDLDDILSDIAKFGHPINVVGTWEPGYVPPLGMMNKRVDGLVADSVDYALLLAISAIILKEEYGG